MGPSPDARRAVLLGAGLGFGLVGLDVASSWGWWGGLAAMTVGLVPMATSTAAVDFVGATVPWWVPVLALGLVTAALAYVSGIAAGRRSQVRRDG